MTVATQDGMWPLREKPGQQYSSAVTREALMKQGTFAQRTTEVALVAHVHYDRPFDNVELFKTVEWALGACTQDFLTAFRRQPQITAHGDVLWALRNNLLDVEMSLRTFGALTSPEERAVLRDLKFSVEQIADVDADEWPTFVQRSAWPVGRCVVKVKVQTVSSVNLDAPVPATLEPVITPLTAVVELVATAPTPTPALELTVVAPLPISAVVADVVTSMPQAVEVVQPTSRQRRKRPEVMGDMPEIVSKGRIPLRVSSSTSTWQWVAIGSRVTHVATGMDWFIRAIAGDCIEVACNGAVDVKHVDEFVISKKHCQVRPRKNGNIDDVLWWRAQYDLPSLDDVMQQAVA